MASCSPSVLIKTKTKTKTPNRAPAYSAQFKDQSSQGGCKTHKSVKPKLNVQTAFLWLSGATPYFGLSWLVGLMLKTRSDGITATVKRQVECHDSLALDKLRGVICGCWLPPSPDSATLRLRWPPLQVSGRQGRST